MADDLGVGQLIGGFKGLAHTGASTFLWIFYAAAACALIWFVWWWMSHNRLVLINFKTKSGAKLFSSDMARKVHIKGAEYWQLRRLKKRWLAPPSDVVRITSKGKFMAECNYDEATDQVVWVELKDDEIIDREGQKVSKTQTHFAPEDKSLLVEQLEEAENRRKGLLDKFMAMAPSLIILLIFVLLLIFWDNIWEPMKESQGQMAALAQSQARTADAQGRIMLLQLRLIEAMMEKKIIDPSTINVQQEMQANAALLGLNQTG